MQNTHIFTLLQALLQKHDEEPTHPPNYKKLLLLSYCGHSWWRLKKTHINNSDHLRDPDSTVCSVCVCTVCVCVYEALTDPDKQTAFPVALSKERRLVRADILKTIPNQETLPNRTRLKVFSLFQWDEDIWSLKKLYNFKLQDVLPWLSVQEANWSQTKTTRIRWMSRPMPVISSCWESINTDVIMRSNGIGSCYISQVVFVISLPFPCRAANWSHTHILSGLQRVRRSGGADIRLPVSWPLPLPAVLLPLWLQPVMTLLVPGRRVWDATEKRPVESSIVSHLLNITTKFFLCERDEQ